MNPAVIEPSHMPRMNRTAKRPPKFLQAACEQSATPHMKMLMLPVPDVKSAPRMTPAPRVPCAPHPFPDGEPLESEVLGILEDEVAQVEDRPEPMTTCIRLLGVWLWVMCHTNCT